MKQITSQKDRKRFYELHKAGQTYREIASEFGVSEECVRLWCRRQRDGGDVQDRYYNPRAGVLSQFTVAVRERIVEMKREHEHWGPASILLNMGKESRFAGQALPSRASIGRYLHRISEFRHVPKKSQGESDPIQPSGYINAGSSISRLISN
jgi:transposase-like protein